MFGINSRNLESYNKIICPYKRETKCHVMVSSCSTTQSETSTSPGTTVSSTSNATTESTICKLKKHGCNFPQCKGHDKLKSNPFSTCRMNQRTLSAETVGIHSWKSQRSSCGSCSSDSGALKSPDSSVGSGSSLSKSRNKSQSRVSIKEEESKKSLEKLGTSASAGSKGGKNADGTGIVPGASGSAVSIGEGRAAGATGGGGSGKNSATGVGGAAGGGVAGVGSTTGVGGTAGGGAAGAGSATVVGNAAGGVAGAGSNTGVGGAAGRSAGGIGGSGSATGVTGAAGAAGGAAGTAGGAAGTAGGAAGTAGGAAGTAGGAAVAAGGGSGATDGAAVATGGAAGAKGGAAGATGGTEGAGGVAGAAGAGGVAGNGGVPGVILGPNGIPGSYDANGNFVPGSYDAAGVFVPGPGGEFGIEKASAEMGAYGSGGPGRAYGPGGYGPGGPGGAFEPGGPYGTSGGAYGSGVGMSSAGVCMSPQSSFECPCSMQFDSRMDGSDSCNYFSNEQDDDHNYNNIRNILMELEDIKNSFECLKQYINNDDDYRETNIKNYQHYNNCDEGCPVKSDVYNQMSSSLDDRVSEFVKENEHLLLQHIEQISPNQSEPVIYDQCDHFRHLSVRIKNSIMFELKNYASLMDYDSSFRKLTAQSYRSRNIEPDYTPKVEKKLTKPLTIVTLPSPIQSIHCRPSCGNKNSLNIYWNVKKFFGISGYEVIVDNEFKQIQKSAICTSMQFNGISPWSPHLIEINVIPSEKSSRKPKWATSFYDYQPCTY